MTTATLADRFDEVLTGRPGDLADFYRDVRESAPVWSPAFNGWVVSRYDDVRTVLTDEAHFGPLGYGAGSSIIHGRTILHMEGDEHRRKGAVLARHLRSTRLLEGPQRDYVREVGTRLADALPRASRSTSRSAFTTPLPLDVIAWLMDIAEAPNFRALYDTIVAAGASNLRGDPDVQRRGEEARAELFAFVTPLIERSAGRSRRRPAEHAVQHRVRGRAAVRRRDAVVLLVPPGRRCGDDRPGAVEPVQAVVASTPSYGRLLGDRRDLLKSACAEGLRFSPPVHAISRGVRADVELSGQPIAGG